MDKDRAEVLIYRTTVGNSVKLQLADNGIQIIESIPEDYGITPMAIVGPCRTGKSSLLNRFVGKNVFPTRQYRYQMTKGVWIYVQFKPAIKRAIMYIDVEYSTKERAHGDNDQLMVIVCQICDVIMYNRKYNGYGYEMTNDLIDTCKPFSRFRIRNQLLSKPIFVSIQRDFFLHPLESPDDVLRKALRDCKEGETMFQLFREIKSVVLVGPKMEKVRDWLDGRKLAEGFIDGLDGLQTFLNDRAKPLHVNINVHLSGKELARSVCKTVAAVNGDDLHGISNIWPEIFKEKNERSRELALEVFENEMKMNWPLPHDTDETLYELEKKNRLATIKEVQKKWISISGCIESEAFEFDGEKQLKEYLTKVINKLQKTMYSIFERISLEKSKSASENVLTGIDHQVKIDSYNKINGYEMYCKEFEQAKMKYMGLRNLGPMKYYVWQECESSRIETKCLIKEKASTWKQECEANKSKNPAYEERREHLLKEIQQKTSTWRKLCALDIAKTGVYVLNGKKKTEYDVKDKLVDNSKTAPQMCSPASGLSKTDTANDAKLIPIGKAELEDLYTREGRFSIDVIKKCNKICPIIKDMSEDIVHVYPAYKLKDDKNIVFVVFAKRNINIQPTWEVEVKVLHQTDERKGRRTDMSHINDCPLPIQKAIEISDIIDKHAFDIINKHTYLSAITAGSKRDGTFSQRAFIILYVHAKHFIPLDEEPFPTEIEGIPVHVREGEFQLCGRSAKQFQENLRMGCSITSSNLPKNNGTLGGFIEHPVYGLCGFTCAHVFLNDYEKYILKEETKRKIKKTEDCLIFQPSYSIENKVGSLVEMTYKEGVDGKPGVDLALFKIERRTPIAGTFPDVGENITDSSYRNGYIWGKEGMPSGNTLVQKFGAVTEQTYGNIQFDNAVVKEIAFHSRMDLSTNQLTTTLFKQYHIKSTANDVPFCRAGDSGALVFMKDNEQNDLRCIGMVVGVVNDTECFVTPITAILEELNVSQLKPFNPVLTWELFDARIKAMENRLEAKINMIQNQQQ